MTLRPGCCGHFPVAHAIGSKCRLNVNLICEKSEIYYHYLIYIHYFILIYLLYLLYLYKLYIYYYISLISKVKLIKEIGITNGMTKITKLLVYSCIRAKIVELISCNLLYQKMLKVFYWNKPFKVARVVNLKLVFTD